MCVTWSYAKRDIFIHVSIVNGGSPRPPVAGERKRVRDKPRISFLRVACGSAVYDHSKSVRDTFAPIVGKSRSRQQERGVTSVITLFAGASNRRETAVSGALSL